MESGLRQPLAEICLQESARGKSGHRKAACLMKIGAASCNVKLTESAAEINRLVALGRRGKGEKAR